MHRLVEWRFHDFANLLGGGVTMMSLLRNPRYRGLVLLAGLVAGLVVVVLVVRLAGGGSTDSGGSGEPAAPPTGPAVVSPEPTAPSPMDSAAVRPVPTI